MNYFKNVSKQFVFLAIIVIAILFLVYYYFESNKSIGSITGSKFQIFSVTAKCADVTFKANDDVMYVNIKYKDLTGLSAIHIHVSNNGMPGPILAWLGTSEAWQRGVAQNTPGSNSPCCSKNNPKCNNLGTRRLARRLCYRPCHCWFFNCSFRKYGVFGHYLYPRFCWLFIYVPA